MNNLNPRFNDMPELLEHYNHVGTHRGLNFIEEVEL